MHQAYDLVASARPRPPAHDGAGAKARQLPRASQHFLPLVVANDDLALALSLLACNSRDREEFRGGRVPA